MLKTNVQGKEATAHFDGQEKARNYAKYRPACKIGVARSIAEFWQKGKTNPSASGDSTVVLDIGCGSGQSSGVFSTFFDQVIGIDISPSQVEEAKKNNSFPNVSFREGSDTDFGQADCSVDVVSSCQAIHWFDIPKFYREADRVLRPGGVLAAVAYIFPFVVVEGKEKELEQPVHEFLSHIHPYWDSRNNLLYERLTTLPTLPYPEVIREDDEHFSKCESSLEDYSKYFTTLTGYHQTKRDRGEEFVQDIHAKMVQSIKDILGVPKEKPASAVQVEMKIEFYIVMCRKPANAQ